MIKKLTYLFLKLDYRDRDKSSNKKFTGIIAGYLFSNTMISMNYYMFFDSMSYAILTFTVNIFLLYFQNLIFAKTHTETFRSLPVEQQDLFTAKLFSAYVYLSLILLSSIIPQGIFFYFFDYSIVKSVVFVFSNYLFSLFSITFILLLFTIILYRIPQKANSILYIFQFAFLAFIMYSASYASKAKLRNSQSIMGLDFVNYLPQKYFALSLYNPVYLLADFLIFAFVFFVFYSVISKNYIKLSDIIFGLETKKRRGRQFKIFSTFQNFIEANFLKIKLEKASYFLALNQFKNSRTIKLRYVPLIFIPLVFCVIGLFMETNKYLVFTDAMIPGFTGNSVLILSPTIIMTFIMCSRLIISNTKIAEENSENIDWIYEILPIDNRKLFLRGVQKFIYINLLLPAFLIALITLSFRIEPVSLFLNMLFIASAVYLVNSIYLLFDNKYPFALKVSKYNSTGRLIEVILMMLLGAGIFTAQIFIFQNIVFILIAIILIFGASVLISKK